MHVDLVAVSYIQLPVHLKYIQFVETTYDTWNALKAIYENTSEVSLLRVLRRQFQELTRKMTAAGDGTPERSYVTRFLCLLRPRFANTVSYITRESHDMIKFATMRSVLEELKLVDERHYDGGRNGGRFSGRGRGRNSGIGRGGGRPNWRGATAHMTGDIDLVHSVVSCVRGVHLADGHPIPVTAMSDLMIKSVETGRTATFKNALYVPTLKKTFVSISRINRQSGDAWLVFKRDHCQLRNKNKLSITAKWNDSYLYGIQGKAILPGIDDEANTAEAADTMLWHARMGHIPAGTLAAASMASIGGPTDLPKQTPRQSTEKKRGNH
ncbi:hypothetical protein DYB25_011199, partial [Aphanomyces astaci]